MQSGHAPQSPREPEQEPACREPERGQLAVLGTAAQLAHLAPVAHGLELVGKTSPGGGAGAPARCLQRIARGLPVVCQQRGTLLEAVLLELLHRARDCGVDARACVGELRVVGDLLCERVLEGVFGVGVERLLVEKFSRHQRTQRRLELIVLEPDDALEHGVGELATEHRSGLEDGLLPLWQPVDARGEHRLHRGRNRDL